MKNLLNRIVSLLLLAVISFSATPKIYIHSFSGHHHDLKHEVCHHDASQVNVSKEKCSFQKLDTPVNYILIDFISELGNQNLNAVGDSPLNNSFFISENHSVIDLRGPPTVC